MAEGMGFEPMIQLTSYDGLANRCLQPLGHPSIWIAPFLTVLGGFVNRLLSKVVN
jgi:hypothetical protein